MVMFNSRKAVSPLIAAVLLIVVVVGIGAVVTGIVRNYVTENKQTIQKTAKDTECSTGVQLNVPTYLDEYMLCKGSNYINVTIENTGTLEVDSLQLKVFGTSGFADNDSIANSNLIPGQTRANFIMGFASSGVGTVSEIFIVPKKKVTGQTSQIFCTEAKLKFVDLRSC